MGVRGWMFRRMPILAPLSLPKDLKFLPRDIINNDWFNSQRLEILGEVFRVESLIKSGFDPKVDGIVLDNLSYLRYLPCSSEISDEAYKKTLLYLTEFGDYCEKNKLAKAFSTSFNSVERVYALLKFLSTCQSSMNLCERSQVNHMIFDNVKAIYEDQEARLGGNHYLRCLLCLSLVFDLSNGKKTKEINERTIARKTLKELDNQFLHDGMHYEISPGYHRLMLMDILDYVQLCKDKNSLVRDYLLRQLPKYLSAMGFFNNQSGSLPQFNDNLPDSFPVVADILHYAEELGLSFVKKSTKLHASGFYSLMANGLQLFLKAGPVGARNQLAHAHSDNLSFELFDSQGWVCGNLPTLTYSAGPNRDITRAESGSSAPQLRRFFQAEHWGVFRVAKCSSDTKVEFSSLSSAHTVIAANHGYVNHNDIQLVERSFSSIGDSLEICTTIKAEEPHMTNLFIDASTSISFISRSQAKLCRKGGIILVTLKDCLFDGDISSIFSDLRKKEFQYLRLRSFLASSSIKFDRQY
jgi:hypothetical protein